MTATDAGRLDCTDRPSRTVRILVVGLGFAGFPCLQRLEKRLPAEAADLVVVLPTDSLLPLLLLPELAGGIVNPRHLAVSLARALPRARLVPGSVVGVDLAGRPVEVGDPEGSGVGPAGARPGQHDPDAAGARGRRARHGVHTGVLDAFPTVRLGVAVVAEVRRRVHQQTRSRRGQHDDPLDRIRRVLRRGAEHLTDTGGRRLRAGLNLDDPHGILREAWPSPPAPPVAGGDT